jgi:hypothetical protein
VTISDAAITVAMGNEIERGATKRAAHRGSLDIRFNAIIPSDDTKNTNRGMQSNNPSTSIDTNSLSALSLLIGRFVALRLALLISQDPMGASDAMQGLINL